MDSTGVVIVVTALIVTFGFTLIFGIAVLIFWKLMDLLLG